MSNIRVRKAGLTDIINLYNCNKSLLPIYYGIDDYLIFLTISTDKEILVAEDENKNMAGYLVAEYEGSNVHILSIGVYKQYRRMGVGYKLIDALHQIVNGNNKINKMSLYVHVDNPGAINLYEKSGFSKTEILKNYYKGLFKPTDSPDGYKMEKRI